MAETYRKAKIEDFLERLVIRKKTLQHQCSSAEFKEQQHFLAGQKAAIDLIISELCLEFDLKEEDAHESGSTAQ
ncbi:hypothetical protein [Paenibacillus ginsengihumi]|jgi:hypothetical protein|uniref:hypothetical protein n=1 Tax=Paenibacillus ginsengihumi TaxID=431596 RepID=UPI0003699B88|nr:hypothetical protein [Paenibacillus ginsengihumi]